MSKTTKKVQNWNNRNPHAEDARLRKAGAIQDRRLRRAEDAGRNWRAEWENELVDKEEDLDPLDPNA